MASNGTRPAKLLFVLSNDYGELSQALDFTRGQPFDSVLLAPGRLHGMNAGRLSARAQRYSTSADVHAAIKAEVPDVVLLFSGYLYGVNQLFDLAALRALVKAIQAVGTPIVTTDPFLGLMAEINASTFRADHPLRDAFAGHFAAVHEVLREIPHLYLSDAGTLAPPHRLSWFNPHALGAHRAAAEGGAPSWLFVLSSEDYSARVLAGGKAAFERTLAGLLRHTHEQGRQPVLIAPEPCVEAIRPMAAGAHLLGHCGHEEFQAHCDAAEHAFFWNALSHSVAGRLLNRRSAFFFNPGHLLEAIPALPERAVAHYYGGVRPRYLDALAPPSAAELDRLASAQDAALEPARAHMRRCPSPADLIATLRNDFKTAGDCPDFAQSSEQNGTVPLPKPF